MPSTGILNGTLSVIRVGGATIAHLTSNDFSFAMETRDCTTKASGGNRAILEALKSFSGSASGYFAEDAAYGFEDLYAVLDARLPVTVRWGTTVVGDMHYEGQAFLTALSRTDGLEESSTFECSFEGTGAVTTVANT